MRVGGGLHVEFIDHSRQGSANRANDYQRDTARQHRGGSFADIPNFAMQDAAVQERQGLVADRSNEQLVSSDYGIVRTRKALLSAIETNELGRAPAGLDPASQTVKSASIITDEDDLNNPNPNPYDWDSTR